MVHVGVWRIGVWGGCRGLVLCCALGWVGWKRMRLYWSPNVPFLYFNWPVLGCGRI